MDNYCLTFTCELSIMFARGLVSTHYTTNFLSIFSLDVPVWARLGWDRGGTGMGHVLTGVNPWGGGPIGIWLQLVHMVRVGVVHAHRMGVHMGVLVRGQWNQTWIHSRGWHHIGVPPEKEHLFWFFGILGYAWSNCILPQNHQDHQTHKLQRYYLGIIMLKIFQ